MKIHLTHVYPPIPDRSCDWHATTDDYDGAPDAGPQMEGCGPTKRDALDDLLMCLEDNEGPAEAINAVRRDLAKLIEAEERREEMPG